MRISDWSSDVCSSDLAKPPLPAHVGLFGKPTVINNVLSLAAVPFIVANGAEAYAQVGFGRSRGTMPIQIAGNVKNGGLYEVGFGITLGELVNRSEEHTSELQSLMRISYAVFCLKKKNNIQTK